MFVSASMGGGNSATAAESPAPVAETQDSKTIEISGKVIDTNGQPIIGATVFETGTANGITTDLNGGFTLTVTEKATLEFSYVGYKPQTLPASQGMVVTLEEALDIDAVVVVGYGVQKKANLSGAVATVKMDEVLGDRPQPNVAAALQGAVPGLMISSSSGNTPGQTGKSIQIRGTSSLGKDSNGNWAVAGLSPLILIDNVEGDIDALNPNDIESVTVLKDASASAIYGARAAAGVVLITTKRPQGNERITANYSNNFGIINAIGTPEQTRLDTYLPIYKEAFNSNSYAAAGQNIDKWLEYLNLYNSDRAALEGLGTLQSNGIFVANEDSKRYYLSQKDIYDRMMETGFSQNHNLSVSGATEHIRFRMSGNSYRENGPFVGNKDLYTRMSFSGYIGADITKWFTQEADFSYSQQQRRHLNDESGGWLYSTRLMNFLPDGTDPNGYTILTPRAIIDNSNARRTTIDTPRFLFRSTFRPVKGLEAVFEYTYQKQMTDFTYFSGMWQATDIQETTKTIPSKDYYIARHFFDTRNSFNAYATYKIDVAQDHHFSLMAGFSQEDYDYKYYNTQAEEQALIDIPSMGNAQGKVTVSDSYADFGIRSGFFRFNYDYKGKYILEVSGRYDGSSKFPKDSRFAFFPSFSMAWNVAEENFMSGTRKWLNQLKPRFSYGSIGNQASAGYYDYIASMGLSTKSTVWLNGNDDANYVTQLGTPGLVSANFTWETITTSNVGLDFALFNNRLTGMFEWFQRDTKDILSEGVDLPGVLGVAAPNQNVGKMRTRGWELQLGWRGNIGEKVQYNVGFNLWDYKSKVMKLNFNSSKSLGSLYEGMNVGEIWGYLYDGFYTVEDFKDTSSWELVDGVPTLQGYSPRPGDYKFKNLNDHQYSDSDENDINSGKNTLSEPGDMTVIGNSLPRLQYGINFGISYAGFDLSVMLQGVGKRDWMYTGELLYTFAAGDAKWYPVFEGTTDYWKPISTDPTSPDYMQPVNPNAKLPRIYGSDSGTIANSGSNRRANDHMLSDASYLRIKNLTLAYTFPKRWMNKIHVSNLRLFVSIENLATFTSLPKGIDPETLSWSYPLYRTVSFGLNFTL